MYAESRAEPIAVLIVDDHHIVRQGVRDFLKTQPDIVLVGEAGDGKEAVRLCGEHLPDVVLMDLVLPGEVDGIEATRQVKRISPRTQVVVLTSFPDDEYVLSAIRAGALSYVLKDVGPEALCDVIRKSAKGEAVLNPRVAARLIEDVRSGKNESPNAFLELSDREIEVLRLIAQGLSNSEIAERLFLSVKTVKGHVSNILSKLQLQDRTQAAVYAWKEGLVRRRG